MSSDDSEDEKVVIVMDNGSARPKAGFAGNKTVSCHIPTICGKLRPGVEASGGKAFYVGDDAIEERWRLSLRYPIERGIIENFDDMEKIWHHLIYNELRVKDDQEFSMLLAEPPINLNSKRERMVQIMFETFSAQTVKIAMQHELALMASGRTTGVIIDSGAEATNIICIHNGKAIKESLEHLPFGGRDLTEFLSKSLTVSGKGKGLKEPVDVAAIKHDVCYIPIDYEEELKHFSSTNQYKSYKTPGGNIIQVESECFRCPEILFKPSIIEQNASGIHLATNNSILKCPSEIHAELYRNIIFAGGNTMFRGIGERMRKEMCTLVPAGLNVRASAPPERLKSVWLGGSIMGGLESFLQDFITKEAYDEHGPMIVSNHSEC